MNLRTRVWIAAIGLITSAGVAHALTADEAPRAPEFFATQAEQWINSPPLSLQDLEGKVVLLEFWTFGCHNCVRSIPWVKAMQERYRDDGLRVIGVHTPEFSYERSASAVRDKVRELAIRHPVMLDNDYAYWNAMGNRYWPAFYLIDRRGRVRQAWAGEIRNGSTRGREIQHQLEAILAE
ncbi:Redoxin domain protein [Oceanococcus atlanticus]|uniref:Redoxin domain protein n=1 Tax=Oceanococcus atlanticus TaxID=1317117 RepID=A0A1Y1SIE0_9GAMM|nr:redoxin domain-containing protein [Oceanococcus atlanticus]ORE89416.1 Redoxin domain protein [Oceanococcus atlanticus]RZO84936.1 MAG: redoxin domain-containing protein [Oceanococcus sp.]